MNKYIDVDSEDNDEDSSDSNDQDIDSSTKKGENKGNAPNSMPKKPLSSYIFFSQKVRDEIKKEKPHLTVPELMKEISSRWQAIKEEDKVPYNKMAKKDRSRYENELSAYKLKSKESHIRDPSEPEPIQRSRSNNEFSGRVANTSFDPDYISSREMRVPPAPRPPTNNRELIGSQMDSQSIGMIRTKKERRSKKNFDYMYRPPPENEDMIMPANADVLEGRSSLSNNRMAVNEDRATERSKPDSIQYAFNEDKEKDSINNKDSPPGNEYMGSFRGNPPEADPNYGDEIGKLLFHYFNNPTTHR